MGLIGLDEEFDRRANTKQITGESGQPLVDVGDNVLATSDGVGKDVRTVRVDHDIGEDGSFFVDVDETYGANVVHMFVDSTNDDHMRVAQQVVDDDDTVQQEYIHKHTEGNTLINTVIPILADSTRLAIQAHQMADTPELEGVLMFTSGNEAAQADYNQEAIVHEQESVSNDGDNTQLSGLSTSGIPHGYELAIKAPQSNSGTVWIGYSEFQGAIDTTTGFPLAAGEGVEYKIREAGQIEAHFPNSADELVWTVEAPFNG